MSADNKWELYSSMPGWQAVSAELDSAMASALTGAEAEIAAGATLSRAALNALKLVGDTMRKYIEFGACDSEPLHHAEWLISKHFQKRYGIEFEL